MTLNWTATVEKTLDGICEHVREEAGRAMARTVERRIIEQAEEVRDFPNAFPEVEEVDTPEIRETLSAPYRILYRLDDVDNPSRIDVIGVVHGTRLLRNTAVSSILDD